MFEQFLNWLCVCHAPHAHTQTHRHASTGKGVGFLCHLSRGATARRAGKGRRGRAVDCNRNDKRTFDRLVDDKLWHLAAVSSSQRGRCLSAVVSLSQCVCVCVCWRLLVSMSAPVLVCQCAPVCLPSCECVCVCVFACVRHVRITD